MCGRLIFRTPVTSIGSSAFKGCIRLKSVTIPDNTEKIEASAFEDCNRMTSITLGSSVKEIGDKAFYNCESVGVVEIPASVTSVGQYAFSDLEDEQSYLLLRGNIESMTLGGSFIHCNVYYKNGNTAPTSTVDDGVFIKYSDVTDGIHLQLPLGLTNEIRLSGRIDGKSVVSANWQDFDIVNMLTIFHDGDCVFTDSSLCDICGRENQSVYDGFEYTVLEDGTLRINKYTGTAADVVIPGEIDGKNVSLIAEMAFYQNKAITSVTIPEGVTEIGMGAFNGCTELRYVRIPDSVKRIGNVAFGGCEKLTVTVPDGAAVDGAFMNCDNVVLLGDITSDDSSGFYNCKLYYPEGKKPAKSSPDARISYTISDKGVSLKVEYYKGSLILRVLKVLTEIDGRKVISAVKEDTNLVGDDLAIAHDGDCVFVDDNRCNICGKTKNDEYGDFTYSVDDSGNVTIVKYNGAGPEVIIPDTINGKPVTTIGERAFISNKYITSVTVPYSKDCINVGKEAFFGCTNATITFSGEEVNFGDSAVERCKNVVLWGYAKGDLEFMLCNVYYFNNKTPAISGTDYANSRINVITLGNGLKLLLKSIDSRETELNVLNSILDVRVIEFERDYDVGDNVIYTHDGDCYFGKDGKCVICGKGKPAMTSGDFTYTLTDNSIGVVITGYNGDGGKVVIPDSIGGLPVREIGEGAFADKNITEVTVPDTIWDLGDNAFRNCGNVILTGDVSTEGSTTFSGSILYYSQSHFVEDAGGYEAKLKYSWITGDSRSIKLTLMNVKDGVTSLHILSEIDGQKVVSLTKSPGFENIIITHEGRHVWDGDKCAICGEDYTHTHTWEITNNKAACGECGEEVTVGGFPEEPITLTEGETVPLNVTVTSAKGYTYTADILSSAPDVVTVGDDFINAVSEGTATLTYTVRLDDSESLTETVTVTVTAEEHEHTYSDEWSYNAVYHWHASTCGHEEAVKDKEVHSWDEGEITTHPTENTEGIKTYTCTVCGETKTEAIAPTEHTHSPSDSWERDSMGHWHNCFGCTEKLDYSIHNWNDGIITTFPTETESGVKTYTCTVCGETKTEAIAPTEHTHSTSDSWEHDFTGHWHNCYGCTEKLDYSVHNWNEGEITTPPTEMTEGVKTYTCTVCGETKTEPVTKLEHTHIPSDEWLSDSAGHWHDCYGCDVKLDYSLHRENGGVVTVQPTETTEGERTYRCTVCGAVTRTERVPATGEEHSHVFGTAWSYDVSSHWHECDCGAKSDISYHIEDGGVVSVQPAETTGGLRTYSCTVCGAVTRTEGIPPLDIPTYIPSVSDVPSYIPPSYIDPSVSASSVLGDDPFIADDAQARGWETITSEVSENDGKDSIKVDMNGADTLPVNILETIENQDVTVEFKMNNKVSWKINGLDVTEPQTLDMRVSTATRKIPESVIDSLGSEKKPIQLRLYHNGDFGFKATLSLKVSDNYNGKYAMLYHYDLKTKEPELVGQCLVSDGKAEFEMTHASYYAVVFRSEPMYEDISSAAGVAAGNVPLDTAAPVTDGVGVPVARLPRIPGFSSKKRRYRILRKRHLDDMVFVY